MGYFKIRKNLILKFIIILIIFSIPAIWIVQQNPKIQNKIANKLIDMLENEWNAKISIKTYDINIFTGKILLKKGTVNSLDDSQDNFSWSFRQAEISFSRLDYFFKDYFLLDLVLNDIDVNTFYKKGNLDINKHFEKIILQETSLGGKLQNVVVNNINLYIKHDLNNLHINLEGSFGAKKFGGLFSNRWSAFFFIRNGFIKLNKKTLFSRLNINGVFSEKNFFTNNFSSIVTGNFLFLNQHYDIKTFQDHIDIHNKNSNLNIFYKTKNKLNLKGLLNLNLITKIIKDKKYSLPSKNINGSCNFDLTLDKKSGLKGKFRFEKLNLPHCKNSSWKGSIGFSKNNCLINFKNTENLIFFDSWHIDSEKVNLFLHLDKKLNFKGKYFLKIEKRDIGNKTIYCKGMFSLKDFILKLNSYFNNKDFLEIEMGLDPYFYFRRVLYSRGKERIIDLNSEAKKVLNGNINFSFFRFLLPYSVKRWFLGKNAKFGVTLNQNNPNVIQGKAFLKEKQLSILKSYNPINNFSFNFLFKKANNGFYIKNFLVNLYKGKLYSPNMQIILNNNFEIKKCDFSLGIDNLLVNWKDNFYSLLKGDINFEQNNKLINITGDIVLKKSLMKENILNLENKDITNLYFLVKPPDLDKHIVNLDLNLTNELPIKIKTGFINLDLNSNLNLSSILVNNRLFNSKIKGDLKAIDGSLDFLQHKLFIDYGRIKFPQNNPNDPIIDLIAKNKINQYIVSLHVTGSLNNPKIILESFPKLSKKQILALLITGSQDINFKTHFSEILQRNLSNLNTKNSFFKKILQSFKFIQITPNFVSQTGKSGLTGTLDIDLNEQLHAKLYKNFNLQDDISFQVDYFLTDDIDIQFLKDQRGEVGAQVEVRLTL